MSEPQVQQILSDAIKEAANDKPSSNHMSLEAMALLIHSQRLDHLEKKITTEFMELKKRQDQVNFLHKLIKTINISTKNNELDCSANEDLKNLLNRAKENGVDIVEGKYKYNSDERDRLIENIRITADDLTVLNDMQLQTITRLTTERYESYQLARSIMKPHHEDKINKARAMAGK